ncbi:MAG: hypothetical protein ABI583_04470 [Betaproteobacteria bacterium]
MTHSTKQSVWMRFFLTFVVFHMALVLPRQSQADVLSDTLTMVGRLGPLLNQYIAPLKLEYLAPMASAISSCSFGSEVAITSCADTILSTPAAKDALGSASVKEIRALLEIYLDVREGDVAELFSDVIKIAAGQSPLELACSVIAIVAGGFPVCDALKALYEVAKLAYEVGKAIVTALADVGCAVYEFFGGSCGSERKVGAVEFVELGFEANPGLAASLQARVSGQAVWDSHKKDAFANAKKQFGAISTGVGGQAIDNIYTPANLEAGWTFYSDKAVYPKWDELVRSTLLDTRRQALLAVTNTIDDAFRAELSRESVASPTAMSAARQQAVKTKLDACTSTDASVGKGIKEWIAAGRAKPAETKAQADLNCAHMVAVRAMPRSPICNNNGVATVSAACSTTNGLAVCTAIQAVIGSAAVQCKLDEKSPAGIAAAKEVSSKNYKQSVDELKKPCSDIACGTQIVQMYERCHDGKGPTEGVGEFAPQNNRDEACGTSYKLIHRLSSASVAIKAHADAEKKRIQAISCKNKAACEESAKKQETDLVNAIGLLRQQTLSTLLTNGVLRSSANKATTEADQKIAQLLATRFVLSATVAGNVVAMNPVTGGGAVIGTTLSPTAGSASMSGALKGGPLGGSTGSTPLGGSAAPSGNVLKPGGFGLSAPAPVPSTPKIDEAALKTCKPFRDRKDEMLCSDARSFAACKSAVDIGKLKTCRLTGATDVYSKP